MSSKHTSHRGYRQRRQAIRRKSFDTDLLRDCDSESLATAVKAPAYESSPVTIASSFASLMPPEMKPLPGAWVTVGKGGRILKDVMYSPPKTSTKKKKKKKARSKVDDEAHDIFLDEEPSNSKAMAAVDSFHRKCSHQDRARERAREAKYWHRYQQAKQGKAEALEQLLFQLMVDGQLDEANALVGEPTGWPRARTAAKRHTHMGSQAERTRRQVRRAAAATRCFEGEGAAVEPTVKEVPELGKQLARFDSSTVATPAGHQRQGREELDDGFERVTRRTRGAAREPRAMPALESEKSNSNEAQKAHTVHKAAKAPKNRKSCAVM